MDPVTFNKKCAEMVWQRYQFTPSRNSDDQRILKSYWLKRAPGQAQPTVVVLNASFAWWLSPCKKSSGVLDFFQKYWWSENPEIWLDERYNWPHPTKSGSHRCYLSLHAKNLRDQFIPSRDIDDQTILQSDWLSTF